MVDVLVVLHVELVQLATPPRRGLPVAGLEVHDADRADADLENGVTKEHADLRGIHRCVGLREREDLPHRDVVALAPEVLEEAFGGRVSFERRGH